MNAFKIGTSAVLAAALMFTGCSKKDTITGSDNSGETKFAYTLTGAFSQKLAERASESLISQMVTTDVVANTKDTIDWPVALDEDALTLTSLMTRVQKPSTYTFELTVNKGAHTYIGSAQNIEFLDADQNNVILNVKPVIGKTDLGFTVANMPKLTFNYKAEDLASLTDPKVGYIIDNGSETIIDLNKTTGDTEVYMSIAEGNHDVKLKLYDGALQVGKSLTAQENVTIEANGDLTMDIIPLHAEATVSMGIENGPGKINLSVPSEVITEAGTLSNLKTTVTLTSAKNSGAGSIDAVLIAADAEYTGSVTFPSLKYDTDVTMTVTFTDIAKGELLGTAVFTGITLDKTIKAFVGNLELIRRAVVSGDVLATTGVNVYDQENNPVAGAVVSVDGKVVGITGKTGVFGTAGYLKFHHTKGSVTVKAVDPDDVVYGEKTVTLTSLRTDNIIITLATAITPQIRVVYSANNPLSPGYDQDIFLWNGIQNIQITNNDVHDHWPSVSGDKIVWQNSNHIFMWDGVSITQIPFEGTAEDPAISGNNVVWSGLKTGDSDYEIYMWDGVEISQISNNGSNDYRPSIEGNKVVWQGDNIYLWDGVTTRVIHHGVGNYPTISNGKIVWFVFDEIYLWDNGTEINISNNNFSDNSPVISGNRVVWYGNPSGAGNEIFMWDGSKVIQITNNTVNDDNPTINGNTIAWRRIENGVTSIYIKTGLDPETKITDGTTKWHYGPAMN